MREVIESARRVTGHAIPARLHSRRAGDPAVLVASSDRALRELGWKPRYTQLDDIMRTAWIPHQEAIQELIRPVATVIWRTVAPNDRRNTHIRRVGARAERKGPKGRGIFNSLRLSSNATSIELPEPGPVAVVKPGLSPLAGTRRFVLS